MAVRAAACTHPRGQSIQTRLLQPPQTVLRNSQPALHRAAARRDLLAKLHPRHRLSGPDRVFSNDELKLAGHCRRTRVAQRHLHAHLAALPIRAHIHIINPRRRSPEDLDWFSDPAAVVRTSDANTSRDLVPMRRLAQDDAINRLPRRVQHAHRQPVRQAGLHCARDIQRERSLTALVATNGDVVHPDLREVIHRVKPQQATPVHIATLGSDELAPIPRHTVIAWQRLLHDTRHAHGPGVRDGPFPPPLLASGVLRVRRHLPIVSFQRNDRRRPRSVFRLCHAHNDHERHQTNESLSMPAVHKRSDLRASARAPAYRPPSAMRAGSSR